MGDFVFSVYMVRLFPPGTVTLTYSESLKRFSILFAFIGDGIENQLVVLGILFYQLIWRLTFVLSFRVDFAERAFESSRGGGVGL